MAWARWGFIGGLCLALGACGGDSGSEPGDNGSEGDPSNADNGDSNEFDDANQQHSNEQDSNDQNSTQQSECSGPSECEMVVCDCPEGPVNFQGCNVVNDVGICATESTCASAFGACD